MDVEKEKRVVEVLVEHLGVDAAQVTTDAVLGDDLRADSLDIVELEMAFEEEFGIDMPDHLIGLDSSVAEVIRAVERQMEAAGHA